MRFPAVFTPTTSSEVPPASETEKARFTEIDVERINVRDPDGTVRMIISHQLPDAVVNGKTYKRSHSLPMAGLLFFNNEGFECGGLWYGGRTENGQPVAGSGLTWDRYNQQDIVSIGYYEVNGRRGYGVTVFDRPEYPLSDFAARVDAALQMPDGPEKQQVLNALARESGTERLFMGRTEDGDAVVQINDSKGPPRIRMRVDKDDIPRLEFLDEHGAVVYSLPPERES